MVPCDHTQVSDFNGIDSSRCRCPRLLSALALLALRARLVASAAQVPRSRFV